jgi:hypothetical protein
VFGFRTFHVSWWFINAEQVGAAGSQQHDADLCAPERSARAEHDAHWNL